MKPSCDKCEDFEYDKTGKGTCTTSIPRGCIGLDKSGSHVLSTKGRNSITCSHCREKVRCWERLGDDTFPPDDWGILTDVGWLCKKCYKDYIKYLEDFVHPDVLKNIKSEGYLSKDG